MAHESVPQIMSRQVQQGSYFSSLGSVSILLDKPTFLQNSYLSLPGKNRTARLFDPVYTATLCILLSGERSIAVFRNVPELRAWFSNACGELKKSPKVCSQDALYGRSIQDVPIGCMCRCSPKCKYRNAKRGRNE